MNSKGHTSRSGLKQSENYAQQSGFTTTVRTGDGHKIAATHLKIDIVEDDPVVALEAQMLN